MISNGENWHYLVVKNLPGLLKGITSNHKEQKISSKHIKKISENHNYCQVEMPNEDNKIIKYNQGEKSIKLPFVI